MKRRRKPTLRLALAAIGVLHKRVAKLERTIRGNKEPIGFTFAHGDQAEFEDTGEWEIDTTETCRRGRG